MKTPLLSMIIPVYNSRPYLGELVQSLCAQTELDFEAVFVDDGSADGSYDEVCRLTANVPFSVTLHRQQNAGVSAARNVGVSLAHGDYLSFVDSDDALHPEYVKTLTQQTGADVVAFRSLRKRVGEALAPHVFETAITATSSADLLTRFVANPTAFSMCNVFIRRVFYEQHALSFAVGYRYYEDYDLFCRTLIAAETVLVAERDLYFYIQRGDSAMTRFTVDRLSCLELIRPLQQQLSATVPAMAWFIPRLHWSIMWQASVAFSLPQACRFARVADMKEQLGHLYTYPDRKVRLSSRLFAVCPALFVLAARLVKRDAPTVKTSPQPFFDYLNSK